MTTMGGGWTAIQKRVTGPLSFDRYWTEYKYGFGLPEQDVWVGNDFIHLLTKDNSSLYVSITLLNGTTLYEMYDRFSVSDEAGKYQLFLAGPATGTLGDAMLDTDYPDHFDLSVMSFSTPDWDDGDSMISYDLSGMFFSTRTEITTGPLVTVLLTVTLGEGGGLTGVIGPSLTVNGPKEELWENPWYPTVPNGTSVKGTTMMIKRQ
ncbi:fibroleukin-like [Saccostrea cucullata]|uniref:fibroleukin-like n=1 Tax=Saccostrea cuccullata TaxID=36930 RepID=UPI002ED4AF11